MLRAFPAWDVGIAASPASSRFRGKSVGTQARCTISGVLATRAGQSDLFDLEEQGVVGSRQEERDVAARSDASDAHHLERMVDHLEMIEQHAPFLRKGLAIPLEERCELVLGRQRGLSHAMEDQRRLVDDARQAPDR